MLKNYKHLAFKEGNGAYFCCSCGKRWTVNDGNPLADACPSCGTKLKYEDIPVPPHGEWISTDVDCTQYRRDASEKGRAYSNSIRSTSTVKTCFTLLTDSYIPKTMTPNKMKNWLPPIAFLRKIWSLLHSRL